MSFVHSRPLSPGATSSRRPGVDRLRSAVALAGLLAVAAVGLAWFWSVGATTSLSSSLSPSSPSPESVLLDVLRLAGVGVTGWLLISTLLALAAATTEMLRGRIRGQVRGQAGETAPESGLSVALRRCALPVVRGLVERALTVTILTSVVAAAPANSVSAAGPGGAAPSGIEEPVVRPPEPAEPRTPPPSPAAPAPADERAIHIPDVHVIVAGDNLWSVAADHLAAEHLSTGAGAPPGEADIGAYWARLIDANRSALRSGDPDLVFPGERIALPPTRR